MYVGVIGSRDFKDKKFVIETLKKEFEHANRMVTGGARGVDTWAEEFAKKKGIPCDVIRPIDPKNKSMYLFRNAEIVALSERLIAFWDGKSKGTAFTIQYAAKREKKVTLYSDTEGQKHGAD